MRVLACVLVAVLAGCGGDDDGGGGSDPDAAGTIDATQSSIDAAAPAPDLVLVGSRTDDSIEMVEQTFDEADCALMESCIGAPGTRQLLRFDVAVANAGNAGLELGEPSNSDPWLYAACHAHYHLPGWSTYELVDDSDTIVAQTQFQAFCVQDGERVDDGGAAEPTHDCFNQGISVGWADLLDGESIPCQWIDITGIPAGNYQLRIRANPDRTLLESDFENDVYQTAVVIPG